LTGGEELLHRTAEESKDRTRPARTKTELVLISVPVGRWEGGRVMPRERVNLRLLVVDPAACLLSLLYCSTVHGAYSAATS